MVITNAYKKGYAFIEYEARKEAETAISEANDSKFLGESIKVDYAFVKGPSNHDDRQHRRERSLSPRRD